MLNNGECDPVCNNMDCMYDNGACGGCADGCTDTEPCSKECSVPNCGYNNCPIAYCGSPNYVCHDDDTITRAAKYYQLLRKDFSVPFNIDTCIQKQPGCTYEVLWNAAKQSSCAQACNNIDCSMSFGFCFMMQAPPPDFGLTVPQNSACTTSFCEICYGNSVDNCLACKAPKLQFFTTCVDSCPPFYVTHPVMTSLCYPNTDNTSEDSPAEIYVSSTHPGPWYGTYSDPFNSIATALAAAQLKYVTIYLLAGNHYIQPLTSSSDYYGIRSHTTMTGNQQTQSTTDDLMSTVGVTRLYTKITSFFCEDDPNPFPHQECVDEDDRANLIYQNTATTLPIFTVTTPLEFSDVVFNGKYELIASCLFPLCHYCPTIVADIYDDLYDEHGNEVTETYPIEQCKKFQKLSLFTVSSSGKLILTNVLIKNFQQQFNSLISTSGGTLIFEDVDFDSNYMNPTGNSNAVIMQSSCNNYACGQFTYNRGSVTLMNNGYELSDTLQTRSFVVADGWAAATITSVTFSFNLFAKNSGTSLFYLKKFKQVTFDACTFTTNFGPAGFLINIQALELNLEETLDASKTLVDYVIDHVVIKNCVFTKNSGTQEGGLITIVHAQDLQNIRISDCTFSDNVVESSGIIKVSYQGNMREEFTRGKTATLQSGSTRVEGVEFPARYFRLKTTSFTNNLTSKNGIVYVSNWANVVFEAVTFTTNGQTSSTTPVTAQTVTVALFIDNSDSYVETAYTTTQYGCSSVVYLENTYSFAGTGVIATSNMCTNGPGWLDMKGMSGFVSLASSTFTSNVGSSATASVIVGQGSSTFAFTTCTFTSNVNQMAAGGGTVGIQSQKASATVTITGCTFTGNSSSSGSGFVTTSGESVTISSSTFTDNSTTDYEGAAIYYAPRSGATTPALSITSCIFKSNASATDGGAISIENTSSVLTPMILTITGSTFDSNTSKLDGSAIYIETGTILSTASVISTTTFSSNQASNRGTVYTAYSAGTLTLDTVTFTSNKSQIAACVYTIHSNSKLVFAKVTMTGNSSDSMVTLGDSTFNKQFSSSAISCVSNTGVCVKGEKVTWTDSSGTYSSNTGDPSGAIYVTGSSVLIVSDATIRTNKGTYGAGVHIAQTSSFTCTRCSLLSNSASIHGGAGYIEQNSYIKLDSSTVSQNTASQGSAFYFVGCLQATSLFTNCQFDANQAALTGTIMMLASALEFAKSKMYLNTAPGDTAGISMTMSTLLISDSVFRDQTGTNGCFLQTTTNGVIQITNTQFNNGQAKLSGGAIFAITSTISITSSTFNSLSAPIGGAISVIVQCVLTLNSVSFSSTTATVSGGGVYGFQGTVSMTGGSFSGFAYGAITADKMDSISISKANFLNGSNSSGGALLITRCLVLSIAQSTFQGNTAATTGGALYLETNPDYPISNVYSLFNNTYSGNTALGAGAVYVNGVSINIQQSFFLSNTATGTPATVASSAITGNAGGILLDCLDFTTCAYNLTDSYFEGNSAVGNGGGIYWRKIMPNMTGTTFGRNTASYAPSVASYPVAIKGVDSNGTLLGYTQSRVLTTTTQAASLEDVAPGQPVTMSLVLALVDHLGNIVKTDNSSPGELGTSSTDIGLSGTTKVTALNGIFNFSAFTVSASPNTTVSISVSSSVINPSLKAISKDNASYYSDVGVSVSLRSCTIGESEVKTSCIVCDSGKYSLDPKGNCNACPSEAICYGNYTMVPQPGYWRTSYLTDVFWACPFSAACIGSPEDMELSYTGYCADGYTGNKCQSCLGGYSRSGTNECGSCPDLAVNSVRLFGIMVLVVIVIVVMVKTSLNSVYRPKAIHSIYIKIFMNYLQLVMLTATFNLEWPNAVLEIFSYQEAAGTVTDQVFSVDCYIASNGKADSKVFYTKLVVFVVMPVILLAFALAFWMFYAFYRHNYTFLKNEFVGTFVILFFLVHPNIIKSLFSAFSCEEIDPGEFWLVNDLSIRCFDSNHVFYSMTIALPGIVIWGIGVPTGCLALIWKNRLLLGKLQMKLRFGFLYNGYELDRFYWEFVILYRKIAIISCSVFLSTISVPVQALTVLLVLVVFLYMQSVHQPYSSPELNLMELRSIMVATVTIYCGLFYLTGDLSEGAKLFFFALIVVSNAYFLILWVRCMMDVGLSILTKNVPWVKKIRMLPELDGLEVDTAINERYINPFVYKLGRQDVFTFIRQTNPEAILRRQATIGAMDRDEKLRAVSSIDMKSVYMSHMSNLLQQDALDSDFTVTPRSPPQEEEKEGLREEELGGEHVIKTSVEQD